MLEVTVAMGLALAGGAVLGSLRRREEEAAYPVAGGRILLRARLAGEDPAASSGTPDVSDLLLEEAPVYRVRLQKAPRTSRGILPSLILGWEEQLVRPLSSALVATGVLSMALLGAGSVRAGTAEEPFPKSDERVGYDDPARWERDLLLADVGAPAPHTFRRKSINSHSNMIVGHANNPLIPHSNTVHVPHTNQDVRPQ